MNTRPVLPTNNVGIRIPSRIYTIHGELLMPQQGLSWSAEFPLARVNGKPFAPLLRRVLGV